MNNSEIINKASQLQAFLGFPNWLNFIGVGEDDGKPCIYLYTNRKKKIPRSWIGIFLVDFSRFKNSLYTIRIPYTKLNMCLSIKSRIFI